MSSLRYVFVRCSSIVFSVRNSACAISRLVMPVGGHPRDAGLAGGQAAAALDRVAARAGAGGDELVVSPCGEGGRVQVGGELDRLRSGSRAAPVGRRAGARRRARRARASSRRAGEGRSTATDIHPPRRSRRRAGRRSLGRPAARRAARSRAGAGRRMRARKRCPRRPAPSASSPRSTSSAAGRRRSARSSGRACGCPTRLPSRGSEDRGAPPRGGRSPRAGARGSGGWRPRRGRHRVRSRPSPCQSRWRPRRRPGSADLDQRERRRADHEARVRAAFSASASASARLPRRHQDAGAQVRGLDEREERAVPLRPLDHAGERAVASTSAPLNSSASGAT